MPLKAINTIPSSHFFKARMIKQLFFFVLISDPRVGTDERLVTFSENSHFLCVIFPCLIPGLHKRPVIITSFRIINNFSLAVISS